MHGENESASKSIDEMVVKAYDQPGDGKIYQSLLLNFTRLCYGLSRSSVFIGAILLLSIIITKSYYYSVSSVRNIPYVGFIFEYINKLDVNNFVDIGAYISNPCLLDLSKIPLFNFITIFGGVVVALIAYVSFFQYIKSKGVLVYSKDKNEKIEGKWYTSLLQLFNALNLVVVITILVYMYLKHSYLQTFALVWFGLFMGFFSYVQINTIKVIHSYIGLEILNTEKILIQTKRDYINSKANAIQSSILVSTFIWAAIGLLKNFNLLVILYIEIIFIICYACVSLIQHIPNNSANITLSNGQHIDHVYVIDEFHDDYLNIIDKDENQIRIMKNSIERIETNIYTKTHTSPLRIIYGIKPIWHYVYWRYRFYDPHDQVNNQAYRLYVPNF